MSNNSNMTGQARLISSGWFIALVTILLLTSGVSLVGQTTQRAAAPPPDALHQLNNAIESLVRRISPSVVQIMVTGYEPTKGDDDGQADVVIGRLRAIGSGVIVDPEGYIVTNAHVLNGAQRIEVVVPSAGSAAHPADADAPGRSYPAQVIGVTREIDLAVLKIEAHNLPALSIRASNPPRQGEMVFAFGSPEGLRNTVTMGVISAVARQPDPDSPLVYVQTDTPINPGNSGGPLVDADGGLVGINTFIFSTSGGNQGLGFAIPVGVVAFAYPQLLKFGHIHQPGIGAIVQAITPELAAGLNLQRDYGLIVSDILPDGPADKAGLKRQDIILSVDGTPTATLPLFAQGLYLHGSGEHAKIEVLRGSDQLHLDISLDEKSHQSDSMLDMADPVENRVRQLGILGLELTPDLAEKFSELRIPTGVVVAAKTLGAADREIPLETGDVIHSVNGATITDLAGLRNALAKVKPGGALALQIERHAQVIYVSFLL